MGKTAGGIFKAGAGCAGCGGLGAFTTGVFAAPTALGTELFQRRNRGLRGLGEVNVPASCWDTPGFKECHDTMFAAAQNEAASMGFSAGTDEYNSYVQTNMDRDLPVCIQACQSQQTSTPPKATTPVYTPPATKPPATTTPAVTPPPVVQQAGMMGFLTSKFWGLPMYAWMGLGSAALVVGLKMARAQAPSYGGYDY